MIIPVARLVIRLSFLFLIVYSIFYFYVLGYRFDIKDKVSYQTSWIYSINVYSKNINFIKVWNKTVFLSDHKVVLYSLPDWICSKLEIWKYYVKHCFDWKHYNKIVYFSKSDIKMLPLKDLAFFKLTLFKSNDFLDKYKFNWNNIEFVYQKNGNLLYKDDLWYKKLINLRNIDFIWYTTDWLVFERKNKIFELKFN